MLVGCEVTLKSGEMIAVVISRIAGYNLHLKH